MAQVCVHTIHIGGSWYGEGRDQAVHGSVESYGDGPGLGDRVNRA